MTTKHDITSKDSLAKRAFQGFQNIVQVHQILHLPREETSSGTCCFHSCLPTFCHADEKVFDVLRRTYIATKWTPRASKSRPLMREKGIKRLSHVCTSLRSQTNIEILGVTLCETVDEKLTATSENLQSNRPVTLTVRTP